MFMKNVKEYQYNLSQPYEDVVKDVRVSTTLRRAVHRYSAL